GGGRRGGGAGGGEAADRRAREPGADRLARDEALSLLAAEDPVAAKVVELRHFAGAGHEDVAAALGVTVYQARQKWTYARAWLRKALGAGGGLFSPPPLFSTGPSANVALEGDAGLGPSSPLRGGGFSPVFGSRAP